MADPDKQLRLRELDREIELASLKSHEMHIRHIYGIRWGGLALSTLTILIGAVMTFSGLQGSFNWAIEAPHSIGAKLTNASPGIVFATVGLIIGFVVLLAKPVNYTIGDRGGGGSILAGPKASSEIRRKSVISIEP